MMLDPEVLEARIALRVAELRTLAAWTAVQMSRTHMPPDQFLEYVTKKKLEHDDKWGQGGMPAEKNRR
jgi:hypothetical protein